VHGVISAIQVSYYPLGAQVMTLVLPLGLFIVVMIVLYFVFSRPHTVPGHQSVSRARPVAPDAATAPSIAAATGLPTATAAGGPEPLADRATPPVVGARSAEAAGEGDTAADETGPGTEAPGNSGSDDAGSTGEREDTE
jgi:hypothetical protein